MTEQEIKALYAESIGSLQLSIEQFEKTLADKPFQSNLKHTVVLGLAQRLVEFARGSEATGRMGLAAANAALGRMCMETVFKLKAICLGAVSAEDYAKQEKVARFQSLKRVLNLSNLSDLFTAEELSEYRDELNQIEKDLGPKVGNHEIKLSTWAHKAEEGATYALAYSVLSDYVHSGASSISHIMEVREGGQVFIQTGPSCHQLESIFEGVCIYLTVAASAIEQMFADELSR